MIATADCATPRTGSATCAPVALALRDILREQEALLAGLNGPQYTQPVGALFAGASIGGHVRHCLDHVRALVAGRGACGIEYDRRDRGTLIERDVAAAAREAALLADAVEALATADADEAVSVTVMPTRGGEMFTYASSLARELAFVLSHTIHHNSTIRGMVLSLGRPVPEAFGYAPATLAHKDRTACAR